MTARRHVSDPRPRLARRAVQGLMVVCALALIRPFTPSPAHAATRRPSTAHPRARSSAPAKRIAAPVPQPDSSGQVIYGEPQLYMAWRAPYGTPGATDTLSVPYDDTTRVDTLYLSFETGRDAPHFYGAYARVYFHPPTGDTLSTYWHWGRGWWNQGNLRVEYDPDGTWPGPQAWVNRGQGAALFDFGESAHSGRLDLVYAVRDDQTAPVQAHTRYCFARVMLRQKKCTLPGAHQPVCIEWMQARLSFGQGDVYATHGPGRFVSANSPSGDVCEPYRRTPMPGSWHPKGPVNPNQPPPQAPEK
jgi:hypothetical protein